MMSLLHRAHHWAERAGSEQGQRPPSALRHISVKHSLSLSLSLTHTHTHRRDEHTVPFSLCHRSCFYGNSLLVSTRAGFRKRHSFYLFLSLSLSLSLSPLSRSLSLSFAYIYACTSTRTP